MEKEHLGRMGITEKIKDVGNKLEGIASTVLLFICMILFGALTYYSARYTWLEDEGIPYDTQDNMWMNLLVLFGSILILFVFYKILKHKKMAAVEERIKAWMPGIVALVTFGLYIISALWVEYCHVQPVGDGMILCQAAHRMLLDNYVDMKEKGYMFIFPHQYGLLSVIHFIFSRFGIMNYKVFQHINAACVPLLFYCGYQIIKLIYNKVGAIISYMILFVTCVPFFLYVPYVYGEVISITFTVVLMWQVIRFCKSGKRSSFLWGTIAIIIACYVRNNSIIVLIAVGIVLLVHSVKEAKPRGIIWLLIMFLLVSGSHRMVEAYYENASGLEISGGVPYISWVRMGLQDSWTGPGWFDNTSIEMFAENGYDTEQTILAEQVRLKEMLADMWEDKSGTIDFFRRKILSQWNSPGYHYRYETKMFDCEPHEFSTFVRKIYFDDEVKVLAFLNRYHFLVYFFVTVLTILLLVKKKERGGLPNYLLYIAIIGGFLFTAMWESGSRYVLPYFMYMIPLAAIGAYQLVKIIDRLCNVKKSEMVKGDN